MNNLTNASAPINDYMTGMRLVREYMAARESVRKMEEQT